MLIGVTHMTTLSEVTRVTNVGIQTRVLLQALVHFVIALASLLTNHGTSGLPNRATCKHFKRICAHTSDNSPSDSSSSCLKNRDANLCKVAPLSCLSIYNIAQRIFETVPPCRRTRYRLCVRLFPTLAIFSVGCSSRNT